MSKNVLILNEQGLVNLKFDAVAYKLSSSEGYVIHRTSGTLTANIRHCDLSVTLVGHPGSAREESLKHRLLFRQFVKASTVALLIIAFATF